MPECLEGQGEHELPRARIFACSVITHPQCLMQGLAWSRPWTSIYGTQMEELPGGRVGGQEGSQTMLSHSVACPWWWLRAQVLVLCSL